MECPCAVSLIAIGSCTLFTVGCGCTVNLVLCLLCGWIFHCVVCGIAKHLYCWSGGLFFYNAEFLLYRGCTVLYALCMRLLVLSVWWCILRCCMLPLLVGYVLVGKRLSVVLSWGGSLSFSGLGGVLLGLGSGIIFMAIRVSAGHQRFCLGLCWNRHLSVCCWRILCKRSIYLPC